MIGSFRRTAKEGFTSICGSFLPQSCRSAVAQSRTLSGIARKPCSGQNKRMRKPLMRTLNVADAAATLKLYCAAASVEASGLARSPEEFSLEYVQGFIGRAATDGVTLGAFLNDRLVGEIHAARPGPRQFYHILGDLTVAVHPDAEGKGVGSALFLAFFDAAAAMLPAIKRIELIARSGNLGALRLYERLGFVSEGRLVGRVLLPGGQTEDDIPMARYL
jgi:ribosomal protein S18 acetylase RimI-like enzyme